MSESGRQRRRLKAACFDLDGTLVDSGPLHARAEAAALKQLGITSLTGDHPVTFGAGVMPGMQMLADHYGIESAQEVFEAYLPAWESLFESGIANMPGSDEVLRLLSDLAVPLALVTSGDSEYVRRVLEIFEWSDVFAHHVTLESVTRLKPAPDAYLTAAGLLGEPPENCAGIEDSPAGFTATASAGMFSVLVNSNQAVLEAAPVEPDLYLRSLESVDRTLAIELFA